MFLTCDGIARNWELLTQPKAMREWLLQIALLLEMEPLGGPLVVSLPVEGTNYSGLTGFLGIRNSSLTCHSYPEFNLLCLDIFSCGKAWNTKKILDFIIQSAQLTDERIAFLFHRGLYEDKPKLISPAIE